LDGISLFSITIDFPILSITAAPEFIAPIQRLAPSMERQMKTAIMKTAMLLFLLLIIPVASFGQTDSSGLRPLPRGLSIPSGTVIDVRLSTTVRTNTYLDGDVIAFEVAQPVVARGVVVIEKGAFAKGRVVKSKRARTFGKGGDLFFLINEVTAVNGSRIPVQLNYRFKGVNDHARTNTEIITTAAVVGLGTYGIGAPVGILIGFFRKGAEVVQPEGKLFEVRVSGTFSLGDGELASTPAAGAGTATGRESSLPSIFNPGRVTLNQILNTASLSDLR
jgi:hypothetical protein